MKKILIVYATAGIGHKKAALAVKAAIDELKPPDTETLLCDALDYTSPFFKWSYLKLYLLAVNKLSAFWGFMYYMTDNYYVNLFVRYARRMNNWFNSKKLRDYLMKERFDVVVSTHFFASEVIGDLKARSKLDTKLITVVTDYRNHSWWVSEGTDLYVVAGDDARNDLIGLNIDSSKIKTCGIPAEPVFSRELAKSAAREKIGLKKGLFTVLVLSGGFGVGPVEEIVRSIGGCESPIQVAVICGHNEELVAKLNAVKAAFKAEMKIFGFVNNVHEFMSAADLLVSKSGGITVTEGLIKGLPILIISPIPGQETRNAEYLLRHGAALPIESAPDLKRIVDDLVVHPEKLEKMRHAITEIRKPMASADIAKLAVNGF